MCMQEVVDVANAAMRSALPLSRGQLCHPHAVSFASFMLPALPLPCCYCHAVSFAMRCQAGNSVSCPHTHHTLCAVHTRMLSAVPATHRQLAVNHRPNDVISRATGQQVIARDGLLQTNSVCAVLSLHQQRWRLQQGRHRRAKPFCQTLQQDRPRRTKPFCRNLQQDRPHRTKPFCQSLQRGCLRLPAVSCQFMNLVAATNRHWPSIYESGCCHRQA